MSNTGLRYAIHFYRRNLIREFSNSPTKVCKITIRHTNRSNLQLPSDNTTAKDKHPCSAASWRWRHITNSDLGTAPKLIFSNDVKIVETLHYYIIWVLCIHFRWNGEILWLPSFLITEHFAFAILDRENSVDVQLLVCIYNIQSGTISQDVLSVVSLFLTNKTFYCMYLPKLHIIIIRLYSANIHN